MPDTKCPTREEVDEAMRKRDGALGALAAVECCEPGSAESSPEWEASKAAGAELHRMVGRVFAELDRLRADVASARMQRDLAEDDIARLTKERDEARREIGRAAGLVREGAAQYPRHGEDRARLFVEARRLDAISDGRHAPSLADDAAPTLALGAEEVCDHGIGFDPEQAEGLSAAEVRSRWPRLFGPCPKGCGFSGIGYASFEHYIMGDW